MFLHCVVWDKAEVDVPWHQYAAQANSLFRFRVILCLLGLVLFLPMLGIVAVSIIKMVLQGEPNLAGIMLAAGLVMVMVPLAIVFALIRKFTMDFVVPIHVSAPRHLPGGLAGILEIAGGQSRQIHGLYSFPNRARHGHRRPRHGGDHGDVLPGVSACS